MIPRHQRFSRVAESQSMCLCVAVLIPSRGEGEGEGVPMGVAVPATTGEVEREDAPQQAQAGKLRGQRA
jgi:hypothetical protein